MTEAAVEGSERTRASNGIQVIARAASILRAVRARPDGLSLGQIAERVDLPRSTVQRIVGALTSEGFLMAASPTGRVRLGPAILSLAAHSKIDVVEIAHPFLKHVAEQTQETIDLSILRHERAVFLDQIVGSQRLRAVSAVGEVFPLHCSANGKACLSLLSDSQVASILKDPLPPYTDNTIRSVKDLCAQLDEVRRTGLAFNFEEHTVGISAIGTGFRDSSGNIYAISSPAPTHRLQEKKDEIGRLILQAREMICAILAT